MGLKTALSVLRKAFCALLVLLCAFLIFVVAWLLIDRFIVKSPMPSFVGYSLLSVESGSMDGDMADSIAKKDIILIHKTENYQIGETITYLRPGDSVPTTHRIVGFDDTSGSREYITRGDANGSAQDAAVTEDMIFGEVVLVFGGSGAFRGFVTDGGGYVFLITFAVILIAGVIFWKMAGKNERATDEDGDSQKENESE